MVQANSLDAETMRLEATAAGLKVERERFVDMGLQERITITNGDPRRPRPISS